ncbi:hypothetical protein CERSUDRAFT_126111 [Gelatoporia subvermispora B]|uniref:Golgi apparatus membrane protein TVP38 n=1 Tax=Ceriporiopsis subvermispora (strain B) TaxID=914234 RepID=M2Q903_CERS8|nr:hypothetical protein CERSUDRAFT_126111 [Gelatoporia subvermispora B]
MEMSSPPPYTTSEVVSVAKDVILEPLSPIPKRAEASVGIREIPRTPSPTPSEFAVLHPGPFNFRRMLDWRYWFTKQWLIRFLILTFAVLFALVFTEYRQDLANAFAPVAHWMRGLPAGWLIPIALMIILSFPPLFGHEIVGILVGLVWGFEIGFGIMAAGTILGELISFFVFRYWCAARGEKLEQTSMRYASIATVVRKGGFKMVLIMRYSAIPSHFSTAVFSTCGISLLSFCAAAVLALPKQFIVVLLGTTLNEEDGANNRTGKLIVDLSLIVTILCTVGGLWYINRRCKAVLPEVVYARRKARQRKLAANVTRVSTTGSPDPSPVEANYDAPTGLPGEVSPTV